ncbi:antitoxin [Caulobacter sp. S45]|uniref:antitoxin n=1 Tax=Caulobacter sp. S45 TaxID=1641861 RepID=UPI0015756701|nr:antitoxin [Caulobacter sp. S45]
MANSDPSFFDEIDEAAEMAADAEALAEMALKGGIPHGKVRAWLDTWGTPDETPPPAAWLK